MVNRRSLQGDLMNYFLYCILFVISLFQAVYAGNERITLHVEPKALVKSSPQDEGTPVVFVHEPFRMTITIESNRKNSAPAIDIKGLDQFDVRGHSQSSNISIINGSLSSTITHEYELLGQTVGKFTLGPAKITQNGNGESDSVLVNVIKKPANFKPQAARESGVDMQVTFETEKKKLVVGEPCIVTLKVKASGPVLSVSADPPQFTGFVTKAMGEDQHAREVIDGKEYQVITRTYQLIPVQEGERILGPVHVNYTYRVHRPRPNRRSATFFADLFDDFSGNRVEQQHASSNELSLTVSPVPSTSQTYSGVGSFDQFEITVDKQTAQEHEPIMLYAQVRGTGNLDQLSAPKLNLPNGWKAYESRSNIDEEEVTNDGQKGRKFFEFVLQIPQAGEWTLPTQTFTAYNPISQKLEEHQSRPIQLTITPGTQTTAPAPVKTHKNDEQEPPSEEDQSGPSTDDIHYIQDDEVPPAYQRNALDWWLFMLLLIAPTLIFSRSFITKIRDYFSTGKNKIEAHCKLIEKAIEKEEASLLYDLFKGLLAEKFHQPIYAMTHDMIGTLLLKDGMKPEKVEEFLEFLNECARFHFIQESRNSFEQKSIIKKSSYWIVFLNQVSKEQS